MPKWYGGSTLNPDELVQPQEQWRDQWQRTLRWFNRAQRIRQKSETHELSLEDIDDTLAFFQNCYHVRDWIKESRPDLENLLNDFLKNHFEMGACRDICNGFKHKNYKQPTHDKDFNLYKEYDYFEIMTEGGGCPVKYRVTFAEGQDVRKFDLFQLIEKCVGLWRQFLDENGLEKLK